MKITKKQFKSLIKQIVKEAIEPVIQKTPNQNHEFDAGRNSVMKAVNLEENDFVFGVVGGIVGSILYKSVIELIEFSLKKGINFIPLNNKTIDILFILFKTKTHEFNDMIPEIKSEIMNLVNSGKLKNFGDLKKWLQDSISKEQSIKEKIGIDGRYQNDMESGTKIKKLHKLKEISFFKKKPKSNFNMDMVKNVISKALKDSKNDKIKAISILTRQANTAIDSEKDIYTIALHYLKRGNTLNSFEDEQTNRDINYIGEETGTGAVGGYSTPFAFSRNKLGSGKAISAAKKYGKVVKSISEKEQK